MFNVRIVDIVLLGVIVVIAVDTPLVRRCEPATDIEDNVVVTGFCELKVTINELLVTCDGARNVAEC